MRWVQKKRCRGNGQCARRTILRGWYSVNWISKDCWRGGGDRLYQTWTEDEVSPVAFIPATWAQGRPCWEYFLPEATEVKSQRRWWQSRLEKSGWLNIRRKRGQTISRGVRLRLSPLVPDFRAGGNKILVQTGLQASKKFLRNWFEHKQVFFAAFYRRWGYGVWMLGASS